MPEDVEMDAPQISTLRDEETPEPQPTPARTSKFRVKLLVNEKKAKRSTASTPSVPRKQPAPSVESEDEDEDEEEEDQLIDDDEDESKPPVPSASAGPVTEKRITAAKRGITSTGRGRGRGGGRRKAQLGRAGASQYSLPFRIGSLTDSTPSETASATIPASATLGSDTTIPSVSAPVGRKRGRGSGVPRAPRKRAPK